MKTDFNTLDVVMPDITMYIPWEDTESYTTEPAYDDYIDWDDEPSDKEYTEYYTETHEAESTIRPNQRPTEVYKDDTHSATTLPPMSEPATTKGSQNKATTKAENQVVYTDGDYAEKSTTEKQNEYQNYSEHGAYIVTGVPETFVIYETNEIQGANEEYATNEAYAVYDGSNDTYTTGEYTDNSASFFGLALIFVIVLVVAALATTIALLVKNNKKKPEAVIVPDQSPGYIRETYNQPENHSVQEIETANNVWGQDNNAQPYEEYPGYNAQNFESGSDVEQ